MKHTYAAVSLLLSCSVAQEWIAVTNKSTRIAALNFTSSTIMALLNHVLQLQEAAELPFSWYGKGLTYPNSS